MALAALQPQPEPKATPRSIEWCEIGRQGLWHTVVPLHEKSRAFILARQITFRNKIPMTRVTCLCVRAPTRSRSPSLGNTVIKRFAFQGLTQRMDYSILASLGARNAGYAGLKLGEATSLICHFGVGSQSLE